MATKSILKNIDIKNKACCSVFINALESAKKKKSKRVTLDKACIEVGGKKIREIFDVSK